MRANREVLIIKKKERVIFHVDCNSFYASVEEVLHPELKEVPMAICGDPESRRGIILAKNELAKKFHIKTAETIWQARQKCPDLVLRPARHPIYSEYCEKINALYEQYTDQVERFGRDESYLDVTGSLHLFGGDALQLAHTIRREVPEQYGITVSVGVSYNKIFAKLASDMKKPNAVTVIPRERFQEIVWPLPAADLFMVGKSTEDVLHGMGIHTIGQLANTSADTLEKRLKKHGRQLYMYANGLDEEPVKRIGEQSDIHSVGNGMTFKRNLSSMEDIRTAVAVLSDTVASRLRNYDRKCMAVQVMIKDPDFKVITRQKPLDRPTWLAADLSREALALIQSSWKIGKPIRLLTVTGIKLIPSNQATEQLTLFQGEDDMENRQKEEQLEKALDAIRGQYGFHSIAPGSVLHNDLGIEKYEKEQDE